MEIERLCSLSPSPLSLPKAIAHHLPNSLFADRVVFTYDNNESTPIPVYQPVDPFTVTYSSPGTYEFVVPYGVRSIQYELHGAGGGGGIGGMNTRHVNAGSGIARGGALRLIWGDGRSYPSSNVQDM